MSDDVPGERSVPTTDDARPRLPDGESTSGTVESPPRPGSRPPWAGRGQPPTAAAAVVVDPGPAAVAAVAAVQPDRREEPTVPVDWPAPVAPLESPTAASEPAAAAPVAPPVPVDWPAPVPAAEPAAAGGGPVAAAAAQGEAVSQPVGASEPVFDEDDDDLVLGAVALALGEAPPAPARSVEPTPAQVTEPKPTEIAATGTAAVAESGPADDDADFGLTAIALALEVEPPFPADLRPPAPEAPEPPPPPASAATEGRPTGDESVRPDGGQPVAAAAMVDAGPTSSAPSPELPGVGMVPPAAIPPKAEAAVASPPDVPVVPAPPPPILPAAMVATPAPPPPPAPPQDDDDNAEAEEAGDDELLQLWAMAEDAKGKDDVEPRRRRRVIGAAAGRWSAMRRGERVNFVLYALTGVSIVAMTLELLAGPDAIPTDVATTPGGSASQTAPTVRSTTTVTFILPPDTEPPAPVVTRAPARVTAPPADDEGPAPDPPADEEEEPAPTPTTHAPATTTPTIPRTTPTTFSNTFPTPVPPVPPTFVGPPVATTAPKIPAP